MTDPIQDENDRLHAEVVRGQRAADLIADPLLAEAFDAVERGYIEAWAGNVAPDGSAVRLGPDGRERLWHAVQVVRSVRETLKSVAETGAMARRQIEDAAGGSRPWWAR
jgi:hypothetical protein